MDNGAQSLEPADGGDMSEVEWKAYCARQSPAPLPEGIKPTNKNVNGWNALKRHALLSGGSGVFWLPKSGNVIGGLGTVAGFTSQDAARAAVAALGLREESGVQS